MVSPPDTPLLTPQHGSPRMSTSHHATASKAHPGRLSLGDGDAASPHRGAKHSVTIDTSALPPAHPLSQAALAAHTAQDVPAQRRSFHGPSSSLPSAPPFSPVTPYSNLSGSPSRPATALSGSDDVPVWARHAIHSPTSMLASARRTIRHLRIEQSSQSIKGVFHIGPSAPDVSPPRYDMPYADMVEKSSSSAVFEGRHSAVNVTVWVHGPHSTSTQLSSDEPYGHRRHGSLEECPDPTRSPLAPSSAEHQPHSHHHHHHLSLHHQPSNGYEGADNHRDGRPGIRAPGKPVMISAKSYMGNVKVIIPQYTCSRPLSVRAKTHNGSIHVHLPPTFSGMISWRSESGTLKPSKAIQARYAVMGERHKDHGVGRICAAPFTDVGDVAGMDSTTSSPHGGEGGAATATAATKTNNTSRGDSLELITTNGNLYLYEAGEASDSSANCTVM